MTGNARRNTFDIVVVGGGIGGLAAAHALARHGYQVCVLERAPQFGEVGAGLQLGPNATRLLDGWGLLDAVAERGVLPARLVLRDALDGQELTSLDLGEEFRQRYHAPYIVVHRTDLHAVLLQACRDSGVTLLTDCEVREVDTNAGRAYARTANGATFVSEVVLAADGQDSTLRRTIVGDAPIDSGFVAYRGTVPVSIAPGSVDLDSVVAWLGPDCHLVQYPLRRKEMINQVAVFRPGRDGRGGATPDDLDAAFAACHRTVRQALSSMWRDRYWRMVDRLPVQTWSRDGVLLLGDAAHPMLQYLAQGACQALEDAHSVAEAAVKLRQDGTPGGSGTDWPAVFTTVERQRQPRTARVQQVARIWGETWHLDGVARQLRNILLRNRSLSDYSYLDWLYGV